MANNRQIGNLFEKKAMKFLKDNGYEIVENNFYAKKLGEIDIVAKKDDIYHFVEVKSGTNFDPIYNLTQLKLNKLIKSISYYLQKNNLDEYYTIDVITFRGEEILFIDNISF